MNYESNDPKSEKKQIKKILAMQGLNSLANGAPG